MRSAKSASRTAAAGSLHSGLQRQPAATFPFGLSLLGAGVG